MFIFGLLQISFILSCNIQSSNTEKCGHQSKRPNIVIIVADDLGWDDVSFHGSNQIPTPNIDQLANEGVILNSHYVSPSGTPTRAAVLTGKHPINLGLQHGSIFSTQPYGLPLDEATLPQYLKPLGYTTHAVGKWHLGFFKNEYTPTKRGFQTFFGFYNDHEDYWDHTTEEQYWGLDLRRNGKIVSNEKNHYGTDMFTQETLNIIKNHNISKPLFIYLAQQAVHTGNNDVPLQAPKRLVQKFKHIHNKERKIYAAMVAALDESVGKVTEALKKKGIYNNTIIVFATDNGGAPNGMGKNWGCNFPLRGGKNTLWEGGVRGVAFIHSKLLVDAGRVSNELMHVSDWLPTLYYAAGGDIRDIKIKLDGYNMWDTLSFSKPSPRKEVVHNIDPVSKNAAIRMGKYKLIVNPDTNFFSSWYRRFSSKKGPDDEELMKVYTLNGAELSCSHWGKRDSTFDCDSSASLCLYDIVTDPCEFDNVFSRQPQIAGMMFKRLVQLGQDAKAVYNPDHESAANPEHYNGTWSPWQVLENNELVHKALRKIPRKMKCYKGLKNMKN